MLLAAVWCNSTVWLRRWRLWLWASANDAVAAWRRRRRSPRRRRDVGPGVEVAGEAVVAARRRRIARRRRDTGLSVVGEAVVGGGVGGLVVVGGAVVGGGVVAGAGVGQGVVAGMGGRVGQGGIVPEPPGLPPDPPALVVVSPPGWSLPGCVVVVLPGRRVVVWPGLHSDRPELPAK